MNTKRIRVEIPGGNSHTVQDLIDIASKCPWDAKIRTEVRPGTDPVIIIWWDEDL